MRLNGIHINKNKAQTTLELTLSFIFIILLLAGMIRLSIWATRTIVGRHNAYLYNFRNSYNNNSEFYNRSTSPYRLPDADIVPDVVR